ncbi:MAG TPA: Rnase Y domain-containing protein, partial [Candidatus Tumulicola sp.]|nr:Rnase Y domain-containing protein [Candidatus Tumulicola sp.]
MSVTALYAAFGVVLILAVAVFFVLGRAAGRAAEHRAQIAAKSTAEETATRITGEARREAETLRKSAIVAGKEETIKLREAWEVDAGRRREELERAERRMQERETGLDRKYDILDQRDKELGRRGSDLGRREKIVGERESELDKLIAEERRRLEQLAGMSARDAKAELMSRLAEEA